MRFLGLIAIGSLALNLVSTDADAAWANMGGAGFANWIGVEPSAERHVWKVASGAVSEYTGGVWVSRDAAASAWQIALPNDPLNNRNNPWIINSSLAIRRWGGAAFAAAIALPPGGWAASIAVSNTTPWVVDGATGTVRTWNGAAWGQPDGGTLMNVAQIAVDGSGTPWAALASGAVYRWNGAAFAPIGATDAAYRLSAQAIIKSSDLQFYFTTTGATWGAAVAPTTATQPQQFARGGSALWVVGDASELYRCVVGSTC
jgi:hypothetical protein